MNPFWNPKRRLIASAVGAVLWRVALAAAFLYALILTIDTIHYH
jgi:hypothetical protein